MKRKFIVFISVLFVAASITAGLIYLFNRPEDLKTKSEILQSFALTLAGIVGGIWALYKFVKQRVYETALEIDLITQILPYDNNDKFLVWIDAVLKNKGQTKISAKPKKYNMKGKAARPVYNDEVETLYHSFGLQIRQISSNIKTNAVLNWFESDNLEKLENISDEINLLYEYEIRPNAIRRFFHIWMGIGKVVFFIEPNEICHCVIPLVLSKGRYIAKVSFVGTRGADEFWGRIFIINVEQELHASFNPIAR